MPSPAPIILGKSALQNQDMPARMKKTLYVIILALALFLLGGILVNRIGAKFNREILVS